MNFLPWSMTKIYELSEETVSVQDFSVSLLSEKLCVLVSSCTRPGEVYIQEEKFNRTRQKISTENDVLLSGLDLVDCKYVNFTSKDGTCVHGFVYIPKDVPEPSPAVLNLHGGPVYSFIRDLNPVAQIFAARGFVILQPNPRGSTGYGLAFRVAPCAA